MAPLDTTIQNELLFWEKSSVQIAAGIALGLGPIWLLIYLTTMHPIVFIIFLSGSFLLFPRLDRSFRKSLEKRRELCPEQAKTFSRDTYSRVFLGLVMSIFVIVCIIVTLATMG